MGFWIIGTDHLHQLPEGEPVKGVQFNGADDKEYAPMPADGNKCQYCLHGINPDLGEPARFAVLDAPVKGKFWCHRKCADAWESDERFIAQLEFDVATEVRRLMAERMRDFDYPRSRVLGRSIEPEVRAAMERQGSQEALKDQVDFGQAPPADHVVGTMVDIEAPVDPETVAAQRALAPVPKASTWPIRDVISLSRILSANGIETDEHLMSDLIDWKRG